MFTNFSQKSNDDCVPQFVFNNCKKNQTPHNWQRIELTISKEVLDTALNYKASSTVVMSNPLSNNMIQIWIDDGYRYKMKHNHDTEFGL